MGVKQFICALTRFELMKQFAAGNPVKHFPWFVEMFRKTLSNFRNKP